MLTREQFQTIIGKYATADDEDTLKDVSDLMTTFDEMSTRSCSRSVTNTKKSMRTW